MTVAWRPTVPETAEMGTYREVPEDDATGGFQPEVGPAKRRVRMAVNTYLVSFTTWMTSAQITELWEMYDQDLERGTLLFTRTHPRLLTTQTFEFVRAPEAGDRTFNLWNVTMQMRWMP